MEHTDTSDSCHLYKTHENLKTIHEQKREFSVTDTISSQKQSTLFRKFQMELDQGDGDGECDEHQRLHPRNGRVSTWIHMELHLCPHSGNAVQPPPICSCPVCAGSTLRRPELVKSDQYFNIPMPQYYSPLTQLLLESRDRHREGHVQISISARVIQTVRLVCGTRTNDETGILQIVIVQSSENVSHWRPCQSPRNRGFHSVGPA